MTPREAVLAGIAMAEEADRINWEARRQAQDTPDEPRPTKPIRDHEAEATAALLCLVNSIHPQGYNYTIADVRTLVDPALTRQSTARLLRFVFPHGSELDVRTKDLAALRGILAPLKKGTLEVTIVPEELRIRWQTRNGRRGGLHLRTNEGAVGRVTRWDPWSPMTPLKYTKILPSEILYCHIGSF